LIEFSAASNLVSGSNQLRAGLPDGLFSNQKNPQILEGLAVEDVGIFYGHLVHFTVFCYILWTFDIVRGNLVYFFPVLVFCTKKNLATLIKSRQNSLVQPDVRIKPIKGRQKLVRAKRG
jgi:hypothetical protein